MNEDRRFQKTRQAISNAMWLLMQEKDFDDISVGEIADRANINRVTFYRHYEDKYAWLNDCVEELLSELFEIGGGELLSAESTNLDRDRSFRNVCDYFDRRFPQYSVLLQNSGVHFFQDHFKKGMMKLSEESRNAPEEQTPEKQLELHFVISAVAGTIEWWVRNDRPMTPEALAKKLASIHRALPWYQTEDA